MGWVETPEMVVSGPGALMRWSGQQIGIPEMEEAGRVAVSWRGSLLEEPS